MVLGTMHGLKKSEERNGQYCTKRVVVCMCQYGHKIKLQVAVDWVSSLDGKVTISGQVAWMEKSQSVC